MSLYRSRPEEVEAVQFNGDSRVVRAFLRDKTKVEGNVLYLLTGKDGAWGWVPVPLGHWVVHPPGDESDCWPVDDAYFQAKYQEAGE